MKMQEVREMTNEELHRAVREHREEMFNLRMQQQTGQLENTARMRNARRDLARLLTANTERAKQHLNQGTE